MNLFATMIIFAATARIWYSLPLIAAVSLCYGATRHERLREISIHALRTSIWVLGFMAAIFLIVTLSSYFI